MVPREIFLYPEEDTMYPKLNPVHVTDIIRYVLSLYTYTYSYIYMFS